MAKKKSTKIIIKFSNDSTTKGKKNPKKSGPGGSNSHRNSSGPAKLKP